MGKSWSVRYCRCGTRLARDNPDTYCSPCRQHAQAAMRCAPQVPDEFWDTEQLREAFASRHMGSVIRAYRHHPAHGSRPLSQELVSGWLGMTQAQLSRIEHGPPVLDLGRLIHWAQTLRIPARCLWFDLPGQRRDGSRDEAASAADAKAVEGVLSPEHLGDGELVHDEDVMMVWLAVTIDGRLALVPMRVSRRSVLAAGGAGLVEVLGGLIDPDEFARVQAAIVTPSRADMATVRHLEALLAHYRRLDDQLGPGRLLGLVQATLAMVDHLRKDAQSPVRQALLSLAGQYDQEVGWLWEDSGNHVMAEHAYDRALARATEAGDQALICHVLVGKGCLALSEGRVDAAIDVIQAAQRGGKDRLPPAVLGYAASREARVWALARESDLCKRKLDEAALLLAESAANGQADEPPWIYYFVEGQLMADHGSCLTDLGEADQAIEVFERAIPMLPTELVRDRAYHFTEQARAHERNRDPEQAAVVAREGAVLAAATGSTRVLKKLHGLHAALSKEHKDVRAVQELGELLR
jgi:tetratricopeptide (TPR) repeat protein/transcriptional regulator with XRE-family HTH domain